MAVIEPLPEMNRARRQDPGKGAAKDMAQISMALHPASGPGKSPNVSLEFFEQLAKKMSAPSSQQWVEALQMVCRELNADGALAGICRETSKPQLLFNCGLLEGPVIDKEFRDFVEDLWRDQATTPGCRKLLIGDGRHAIYYGLCCADSSILYLVLWGKPRLKFQDLTLARIFLYLANNLRPGVCQGPVDHYLEKENDDKRFPANYVVCKSQAVELLHNEIELLSSSDLPILIVGETGVGKEHVARLLHSWSGRRSGPFVAVNCAAIPGDLLEPELFGIGRGVATGVMERKGYFQLAEGGSLFLDEISEMSLHLQAKLLRALQEKKVYSVGGRPINLNVRILAATNTDVTRLMEEGKFRADLFYRIAGSVLRVPPLRERKGDLSLLLNHFLRNSPTARGKNIRGFRQDALEMLYAYEWPGNVRELEHEAQRAALLCPGEQMIEVRMLSDRIRVVKHRPPEQAAQTSEQSLNLESQIESLERMLVGRALERAWGNKAKAASLLGITRNGLAMKMKRLRVGG